MNEIDPSVQIDSPLTEPSKQYILTVANSIDFDYPQVILINILFYFALNFYL